jgi:hypothetical protein
MLRTRDIWAEHHSAYVERKRADKKRHSLRALRLRLFHRAVIECKNPRCRVQFVPYRSTTLYCSASCRVRTLSLAAYHRRRLGWTPRACCVCGAEVRRRKRDAIYCSVQCNSKATWLRKVDRAAR